MVDAQSCTKYRDGRGRIRPGRRRVVLVVVLEVVIIVVVKIVNVVIVVAVVAYSSYSRHDPRARRYHSGRRLSHRGCPVVVAVMLVVVGVV